MRSITGRYWKTPEKEVNNSETDTLAKTLNLDSDIIALLQKRGLRDEKSIEKFLFPKLADLEEPFAMKGMKEAVIHAQEAIEKNSHILIWGDYDVDGVTSTALLLKFFNNFTDNISWFIPNRFTHGYGLNPEVLREKLLQNTPENTLLITVDCGITNLDEINMAKKMGSKVIVTDHHEPTETLPPADAILNVKQEGCAFQNKSLAGVGTAFYLALGIRAEFMRIGYFSGDKQIPNMKELLELVSIGTIADMVDLSGSNRVLVKAGFEVIDTKPSIGVAALLKESNIFTGKINSEEIGYQLAPKINAAGRLEEASLAVNLLNATNKEKAEKIAKKLSNLNNKRKNLCSECLDSTLTFYHKELFIDENKVIVLKVDGSIGVLGIVASQLLEKVKKPIILVSEATDRNSQNVLKGSCRSIPGVDIHAALEHSDRYLMQYGGHKMAAGLTLLEENLEGFSRVINEYVESQDSPNAVFESIDLEIPIEKALSENFVNQLNMLEPHGVGNKKPIFFDNEIEVQDVRKIGKSGDHVTFNKRGKFEKSKCIGFRFGEHEQELRNRPELDVIFSVSISKFKRAINYQAQVVDILE